MATHAERIDWLKAGDEAVSIFKDLLRIDTTNPPGNERPAADYLARLFSAENIEHEIIEAAPERASIVARLRGNGKKKPLLLNGHLDVVPADREYWTYEPFEAVEADGCIWGRGAIDMKNMVAMSVATLLQLKRQEAELERDVIFAGVADEEAGSRNGSLYLVENRPELVECEYVLNEVGGHTLYIGESRFYPIQVSEKGICWFEITAEGEPGHGSMPKPGNPVGRIARAITDLMNTRLPQHNTHVVEEFVRALASKATFPQNRLLPLLLQPVLSGRLLDVLQKVNPDQAIALNAMFRNTASPTGLTGSNKINVIPSKASVQVDGRIIPGQSVETFLEEIKRVVGHDLRISILEHHEGTSFRADTELYEAISNAIEKHDPGAVPVPYMIPGFTDSFSYARLGATCYGFSPVRLGPEINFNRLYHGHDERIPVEGFRWGFRVLYDLVRDFCGPRAG